MSTVLKVTGLNTDQWPVKSVGLILAIGSALSLTLIEVIYVAGRVISPIYPGDATAELVRIGWWVLSLALS